MKNRQWYVEYFDSDSSNMYVKFFRYEVDAKKFCEEVGGWIAFDHFHVASDLQLDNATALQTIPLN